MNVVAAVLSGRGAVSITEFVIAVVCVWAGVSGGWKAFRKGARLSLPPVQAPAPPLEEPITETWARLCVRADDVIKGLIFAFPADVKKEAELVPYLFREHAETERPGYRTLGRYHNFVPGRTSDHKGPIFLFLRSIAEFCAQSGEEFEAKVASTYLHELGHHFGWDEVDLVRHGLPSGRPPGEGT